MSRLMDIVEGATEALDFQLLVRLYGSTGSTPVDLTGLLTPAMVIRDGRGVTVKDGTTGVSILNTTAGTVRYAPSSSDVAFSAAKSPYRVRFRVTDALTKTLYFPNGDEDLIAVKPV